MTPPVAVRHRDSVPLREAAAADGIGQMSLFCGRCCGSGVVVMTQLDRHGERVQVPAPCPTCRPRPAAPETWRAAVKLARRLAREQAADGH